MYTGGFKLKQKKKNIKTDFAKKKPFKNHPYNQMISSGLKTCLE